MSAEIRSARGAARRSAISSRRYPRNQRPASIDASKSAGNSPVNVVNGQSLRQQRRCRD